MERINGNVSEYVDANKRRAYHVLPGKLHSFIRKLKTIYSKSCRVSDLSHVFHNCTKTDKFASFEICIKLHKRHGTDTTKSCNSGEMHAFKNVKRAPN